MLKIEKFTDVCMTGGMYYTPSHTNVCKFYVRGGTRQETRANKTARNRA